MQQQLKVCKIVLVGDQGVGKRSLLTRAFSISQRLSPFYIRKIVSITLFLILLAIECTEVEGQAQDSEVKLHLYDSLVNNTMVTKENQMLVNQFCQAVIPPAQAVLMCFAADDTQSLVNLREWIHTIKDFLRPSTCVYLVATKADTRAQVDSELYEEIKQEIGSIHGRFSTSSVTGENIEGLFAHIMNNFVNLPFKYNETTLESEMALARQGIATPRKSVISHDMPPCTPSFVMVTPERQVVCHESATFEDAVMSQGETIVKTRVIQEVHRALETTADNSRYHRHTRSASSFAWKTDSKSIVNSENKLMPKYIDQDMTLPEDEEELQMDYLKPRKLVSDDFIKFAIPCKKERPSVREINNTSIEIKINYVEQEESFEGKLYWRHEKVIRQPPKRIEKQEPQVEIETETEVSSPHYIKIWF